MAIATERLGKVRRAKPIVEAPSSDPVERIDGHILADNPTVQRRFDSLFPSIGSDSKMQHFFDECFEDGAFCSEGSDDALVLAYQELKERRIREATETSRG